jgi:hypothetical protein
MVCLRNICINTLHKGDGDDDDDDDDNNNNNNTGSPKQKSLIRGAISFLNPKLLYNSPQSGFQT